MSKHGDITAVSEGNIGKTKFRPGARVYYESARHGILFHKFNLPLPSRANRNDAVKDAIKWLKRGGRDEIRERYNSMAAQQGLPAID